jgi:lysophospholipase L1-like esterase
MRRYARVLSLILLVLLLAGQFVQTASAISDEQMKLFRENINYFDIDACTSPSAQSSGGADPVNVSKIYLLGDSIMVGAYYAGGDPLKQAISDKGWSSQADASGGRGMSYAGSDPRGNLPGRTKSGLDAIKADADAIRGSDTVIIELGTNETNPPAGANKSSALFKGEMEQAIQEVKNINSSAHIYWVNLFSQPSQPYTPWVKQYNQVISSVAADKDITVIDTTKAGITLADGTHPDANGYKKLSKVITDSLSNASTPAGDTAPTGALQPGSGAPDGSTFPSLDPTAMAGAIDKWVVKENPNTKMKGLGTTIVADAQHSNISPFLIVGIARMESSMADPSDYNVSHGNNAFGRTATSSQPHFQGAQMWYKWSSVKASVDYKAPENQGINGGGDIAAYIRSAYPDLLGQNLQGFFQKYSDNSSLYASNVQQWIKELVDLSGQKLSPEGDATASANTVCCPGQNDSGGASTTTLTGKNNQEKIYNFFVGKGLEPFQAAGIMGNIDTESAGTFSPRIVQGGSYSDNPSDAGSGGYGLFQFTPGSKLNSIINKAHINGAPNLVATQLDAVWAQLTGKAGSFNETQALKDVKAAKDVHDATGAFMGAGDYYGYERPLDQSESALAPRVAAARGFLTEFGGSSVSAAGDTPTDPSSSDACCPPTSGDGEVQDGSPSSWKKMYTGSNKSKVAELAHGNLPNPKILVIHYTVGEQEGQALLDYFTGTPDKLGIQFNVGKDGQIYQYYPLNAMKETYHVGDANSKAIGIEITGRDVNELLNNQKQFDSVASLSKFLCGNYNIPCGEAKGDMTGDSLSAAQGMLGHDETPTNDHNDPDAKYGQTITRTDSSKHPYMMKLRTALGFDPTPGRKGGAASPGTVTAPSDGSTAPSGSTGACASSSADTVTGNGTSKNPVGDGPNKALALEAVQYDTKTNAKNGKDYHYTWGGLHGPVSQLQDFAKNGGGTDCSGFVRYIIWKVYGVDVGSFQTQNLPSMSDFQEVSPGQVAAGDIAWRSEHVDFITDNLGGGKLHEFGAHDTDSDLYGGAADASDYTKFFRYVGPKNNGSR